MFKDTPAFSSFSVPDMEAAKKFYGDVLGLDVKETKEGLEVGLMGGAHVFLYPSTEYNAPECTILNFVVEDVEKAVDELNGKGVMMDQYPDFNTDAKGICHNNGEWPGPKAIAWFKDPAGHILSVMQKE
jgi:catechol 2,3-dioxygenase-like lactoylglutathione lyase family enzyme